MQAIYQNGSDTIRKLPENYCLIAFRTNGDKEVDFDVDGATVPYREFVQDAYQKWQENDSKDKNELAALVSEEIEKGYRPFRYYPVYDRFDVSNAINMLRKENISKFPRMEREYRVAREKLWEQKQLKNGELVKDFQRILDETVSEIYYLFQETVE
ncbi:hypothetical protein MZM54_04030 [[Brevibacterium] frigoritolerans]|nr:hypothetical protein [Peribacillus frigoritolerans]